MKNPRAWDFLFCLFFLVSFFLLILEIKKALTSEVSVFKGVSEVKSESP